ncbi:hypothetical protein CDD80_2478 [Ophiocordyceps camponoti-rufipedis]|uniref:Acyl carrier protein n=1 Tax=Ophiocordyceps camponoti-rufipedis TaxID=2004952 RepID=A0A2C5Z6H7_9HYPO|nr:hypothetical protein CDD80_2478 [Ophiocordyceps camponoti-rufipedis]
MFRVAVVRAASAAAATAATRPVQRLALQPAAVRIMAPAAGRVMSRPCFGARFYSSENGLEKEQIEGRIMSLLQGFDKITPTAHFANDMGLDSLDAVEVVMAIEEEFSIEIPDKDADAIHSVKEAVQYIMNQPDAS